MILKPATSTNLLSHDSKLSKLTPYPNQVLNFNLDYVSGDQVTIKALPGRNLVDDLAVWINGNIYEGLDETTLDLSTTGLNTGIIDGITFVAANNRNFLIWGLANDSNSGFEGFGLTHKPYSTYTTPATANKGALVTFGGLTRAYQFTEGARVAIRNTVGSAPLYQWNWGTISAINSDTSIDITMDNEAYGSNLTAATGGEILQWDKFRPWIVTSTSQELYNLNYRLLGELDSHTSGGILSAYKVDDPWRSASEEIYNSTALQTGVTTYLGRVIPLWAVGVNVRMFYKTSDTGRLFEMRRDAASSQIESQTVAAALNHRGMGFCEMGSLCSSYIIANHATTTAFVINLRNYYVPGGMRI